MTTTLNRATWALALLAILALTGAPVLHADEAPAGGATPPAEAAKSADFTLKDLDGKERKLSEFEGKWVVLEWTNYGCPFVKKHYDPPHMQGLQAKYTGKGVVWLSICSSAPGKQGHMSAADWKKTIAVSGAKATAVLLDEDGKVGKLYGATRTPEIRVIDPKRVLVYSGAIDDQPSAKADPAQSKNYLVEVLDAVLAGKTCPHAKTEPYGCSVKYAN